jgi:DNA-binding response OmpR family regulator
MKSPLVRVLIIEDEILIGVELEFALRDAGYEPIGPAINVAEAQVMVASEPFDAAVVDVGLVAKSTDDILRWLVEAGVPILFMSGHDIDVLPAWGPATDNIMKPFLGPELIQKLGTMLETAAAAG